MIKYRIAEGDRVVISESNKIGTVVDILKDGTKPYYVLLDETMNNIKKHELCSFGELELFVEKEYYNNGVKVDKFEYQVGQEVQYLHNIFAGTQTGTITGRLVEIDYLGNPKTKYYMIRSEYDGNIHYIREFYVLPIDYVSTGALQDMAIFKKARGVK